ncbi:CAP domain-containing protein [Maribacter sp. CXY002]|uniref:CAP domain-containing protein n=1 Tax=Maribacter luteocoastalis TaxID=3407671 RepID=UPI003B67CA7A
MKNKFIIIGLALGILSSCSKYESDSLYQEELNGVNQETTLFSSDKHSVIENELFTLVNDYRISIGLNALEFDSVTYYYAGEHTNYMISKGVMSHDNFNERASKIANRTGAEIVAENVARNYETMQEILDGWLSSPSHKKNLEGNYDYSAINIKPDANGNLYVTHMFFK